jgi:hypothetical protein
MATVKTLPTTASVAAYVDAIADEARRADCRQLGALMQRVTGCAPRMWGAGMVGFDQYHYRYESGREGDMFVIGFAARKGPISIYMAAGCDVDATLLARLGHYKRGKACLYVNRLADVSLPVLEQLLARAVAGTKQRYPANPKQGSAT